MRKIFLTLLFFYSAILWAGPESYDHLSPWKKYSPEQPGPANETVKTGGEAKAVALYTYGLHGELKRADYHQDGSSTGYSIYAYENKRIVREDIYSPDNKLTETLSYSYNAKGNLTGYSVSGQQNEGVSWKFSYSGNTLVSGEKMEGMEAAESFTIEQTSPLRRTQFIYVSGAKGKVLAGSISFVYKNNLLKERVRTAGESVQKIVYTYDNKGRLIKMDFYNQDPGQNKLSHVKTHSLDYSKNTARSN